MPPRAVLFVCTWDAWLQVESDEEQDDDSGSQTVSSTAWMPAHSATLCWKVCQSGLPPCKVTIGDTMLSDFGVAGATSRAARKEGV